MGFLDKLMGRSAAAEPKKEKSIPPPKPGRKEAVVKNPEGRVQALRATAQYVTTKEANQFLSAKFQELAMDLDARHKAGLPTAGLDAEAARLKAFKATVDARMESPEGKERIYNAKEVMVENPWYQTEPETMDEGDIISESPDVDVQREVLVNLMHRRDQLMKQRDELMKGIKGTVNETTAWQVGGLKAHAAAIEQPAIYPNYFPTDIERANLVDATRDRAEKLEQESKESRREMSEPLRLVLDELDDVQEEIAKKEKNIAFIEKKYGSADTSKAA